MQKTRNIADGIMGKHWKTCIITNPILLTTKQVAEKLNLKPRRLRAIAKNRSIGKKLGRDLVFYEHEVELLKPGKPGNKEVYKHSPNWKKRRQ